MPDRKISTKNEGGQGTKNGKTGEKIPGAPAALDNPGGNMYNESTRLRRPAAAGHTVPDVPAGTKLFRIRKEFLWTSS